MDTLTIKLRWRPEKMEPMGETERAAVKQEVKDALVDAINYVLNPRGEVQGWVVES